VSLQKALAQGFPLAALRALGAAYISGGVPYISAARLCPQLLDPAAARRDVARLRRDRNAARPEHDAVRMALLRDANMRPWSEGAHVEAVARGILSKAHAVAVARAAQDAWSFLRRPDVRAARACASQEVKEALDACVAARLGPRLMRFAGALPPPDVSPRGLTIAMVNRVLGGRRPPTAEGSFGLLAGARHVAWTPETHAFVCSAQTRQGVRHLLLHLCRLFGVAAGSEIACCVLRFIFAPDEKVEERAVTSTPADGDCSAAAEPPPPVEPPPSAMPIVENTPLARREPRFGFFLQASDAGEPRGVLVPSFDNW
jgi:hypothetical protein